MKKKQTNKEMSTSDIFCVNMVGLMAVQKISSAEIAPLMGISLPTYYRRIKNPYEFTLGNMKRAAACFGVALTDMLGKVMTVGTGEIGTGET